MGFLNFILGKKEPEQDVRPFIRQYLDAHGESLLASWLAPDEESGTPGFYDKKEMVRKDTLLVAGEVSEILKENRIKPPANLANLVREEVNERIMAEAKPVISQFVARYQKPEDIWPSSPEIPLQDTEKLEKLLAQNSIDLGLLYYDLSEEQIRRMLEKHGIRRRPPFQDPDTWALNFSYSNEDVIALKATLKENQISIQAIDHLLGNLRCLARDELQAQLDERFERAFRKANRQLPSSPTRDQWISAYVNTFGKDLDYLDYLQRLAHRHGTVFEKEEMGQLLEAELERQRFERLRL